MATFAGSYNDGQTAAQTRVAISLQINGIELRGPDGQVAARWDYEALDYVETPYAGRPVRLMNGDEDPARLTISDPALLEPLIERAPQLAPRKHRQTGPWRAVGFGLLGMGLVIGVLLYALPWVAGKAARVIPQSWEVALGERVKEELGSVLALFGDGRPADCAEPAGVASLEALVARLAADDDSGYDYRVQVIDHPMVNAFALPGGYIVILRGLIDTADSPDVVAGVLAHEMGHVTGRHGTEALLRNISLAFLFDVLFEDPTGGGLSGVGLALTNLSYGRDAEKAADQLALKRLARVDITASGLSAFFTQLQKAQGGAEAPGALQLFSTHPSHASRLALFEAAKGKGGPSMSDQAWADLQGICGQNE